MEKKAEKAMELCDASIWSALETVKDPEIPVLSLTEMGMITAVAHSSENNRSLALVKLTPTFVGCPAIEYMKNEIRAVVKQKGFDEVNVEIDLSSPWSTNRMSAEAKEKLEKFGIAPPPAYLKEEELSLEMLDRVRCPHCGSTDTTLRSSFGATLCRAIRFCFNCKQGFEQFKPV